MKIVEEKRDYISFFSGMLSLISLIVYIALFRPGRNILFMVMLSLLSYASGVMVFTKNKSENRVYNKLLAVFGMILGTPSLVYGLLTLL